MAPKYYVSRRERENARKQRRALKLAKRRASNVVSDHLMRGNTNNDMAQRQPPALGSVARITGQI